MPRRVLTLLIIFFITRMALSLLFPLTADESYYWLWSKHLALSYVDHPPMIAYVNFLFTFGQESLLGLRLGANLLFFMISILLYLVVKRSANENIAYYSTLILQIMPHYLIIWLTQFVEIPLAFFWMLSILLLVIIMQSKNEKLWYLLAITLGLGYLSKYTMFLFWPCLAIFFLISPQNRFWLKKKELYFSAIISILFFLPVLWWNYQHQWISFTYHSGKALADAPGANFFAFLADQLVHFTPFVVFGLFNAGRYCMKKDQKSKLLFAFSIPILIFFFLLSFKVKVWSHWPAIGYLLSIPCLVIYFTDKKKALGKFISWITVFTFLILGILFWLSPAILLNQGNYPKNRVLKTIIPQNIKIYTKNNVSASLLQFYLKRPTYLATGFLKTGYPWGEKQYEVWGVPNLAPGEEVIYFGEDTKEIRKKALKHFKKIEILPYKMQLIEDYISNNFKFFKLINYQGGNSHP